jgi:phasin family protein
MAANPFADWTKLFGDFKAPAVDLNQIISLYRRNAETSSAVLQILTESTQAIAKRQAEILRSNAEQALKASKELVNKSTPESAAAKQADFAKGWLEYNVNSLREIAEMSTKSTQEAFDVINKRVAEQMKEFSDVAGSHAHATKKKAAA